ncbi:arylesterase [Azospirillum sp. TSO22-1]|uniref:arylesterase n=1 Tax=Azospirillum sp. TSO22-1 TaxID=716789 RepID=UPI000D65E61B|nr:arylesterase [Azospirillum sp. TSO22-1]
MAYRLFNAALAGLLALGVWSMSAAAHAAPVRLVALGDSLTAGYGLPPEQGFTVVLETALKAKGYDVTVVNAGVSGDTTAGGRARLDWTLGDRPDAMIVELGANDMLRGIDPGVARANLDAILKTISERKIPVLLAGMYASGTYGKAYVDRFNAIYPELAQAYGVPLYPFFLDGVATDARLNQGDGIHPNATGVQRIVEGILPYVTRLLDQRAHGG